MKDPKPAAAGGVDVRSDRVTAAAVAHVAARERVRDLTTARNRIECARMAPARDEAIMEGDYRTAGYPDAPDGGWQYEPCWKMEFELAEFECGREDDGGWWPVGGAYHEWCGACQRRQALHTELQRAKKAIGGTYLALRLAVRGMP